MWAFYIQIYGTIHLGFVYSADTDVDGGRGCRLCAFGRLCVDIHGRLVHQWSFLLFDCFRWLVHCWYMVGTVLVDMWRLVHQWSFLLFWHKYAKYAYAVRVHRMHKAICLHSASPWFAVTKWKKHWLKMQEVLGSMLSSDNFFLVYFFYTLVFYCIMRYFHQHLQMFR